MTHGDENFNIKKGNKIQKQDLNTTYQALDNRIVGLCQTSLALRRKLTHLSMTHGSDLEVGKGIDSKLELIYSGQKSEIDNENEILAILEKQKFALLEDPSKSPPRSPPRSAALQNKSEGILPSGLNDEVGHAVQKEMISAISQVIWSDKFEISFLDFKRKQRWTAHKASAMFKSFLLSQQFRALHASKCGVTRFDEDTTGVYAEVDEDEADGIQLNGMEKRIGKFTKPVRESLELSLSTHILDNLDHLAEIYSRARRDFLSNMTLCCKMKREKLEKKKKYEADLRVRREKLKKEVHRCRSILDQEQEIEIGQNAALTTRHSNSKSAQRKISLDAPTIWPKPTVNVVDSTVARALTNTVEYAKKIRTQGGGLPTPQSRAGDHRILVHHITTMQRMYRGHLMRRYVWALKWISCIWEKAFYPTEGHNDMLELGYMKLDDFEATYEHFCFNMYELFCCKYGNY